MGKIKARYIFATIITLIGAVFVYAIEYEVFYRSEDAVLTIKKIPLEMGKWHGNDFSLTEDVYDILETRAILHRSYQFGRQKVFLSLVFYPDTKVDFHAPEACLAGRGRKIKKLTKTIRFEKNGSKINLDIKQLTYEYGQNRDLVYYFYKAGSFMGENYILMRLNLAKNKVAGHGSSGSLIRISTTDETIGGISSEKRLENFVADLYPYLIQYL